MTELGPVLPGPHIKPMSWADEHTDAQPPPVPWHGWLFNKESA